MDSHFNLLSMLILVINIQMSFSTNNDGEYELKPQLKTYELSYICWFIISINLLGGLVFFFFSRPIDPKSRTEHGEEQIRTKSVKVTYIETI